jgi:hypothetical protein
MPPLPSPPPHVLSGSFTLNRVSPQAKWKDLLLFRQPTFAPRNWTSPSYSSTITGAPTRVISSIGYGVGVVSGAAVNIPRRENLAAGDFTVRVIHRPNVLTGGYRSLFDCYSSARELSVFLGTTGDISYDTIGGDAACLTGAAASTGMATGSIWDFVITRKGSGGSLVLSSYVNGALKGTTANSGFSSVGGAMSLGNNTSGGGDHYDGTYFFYGWMPRCATAVEVANWYSDPYDLYDCPRRKTYFMPTAAATTYPSRLLLLGVG